MKVKVTRNFVDKVESEKLKQEVLRTVGEEFTVSKERFDEIKRQGNFVKEVITKSAPKKRVK
jgi:hypothetical protein